jgi:uncharacterized coiled-coil DUF342 family protein
MEFIEEMTLIQKQLGEFSKQMAQSTNINETQMYISKITSLHVRASELNQKIQKLIQERMKAMEEISNA